jgi:hypothetical protein
MVMMVLAPVIVLGPSPRHGLNGAKRKGDGDQEGDQQFGRTKARRHESVADGKNNVFNGILHGVKTSMPHNA